MAPPSQTGSISSTASQTTPSTEPVASPSWSFRKASPLRFWRRLRALTTKIASTSWPSTRSRTKHFVGIRVGCSICIAKVEAGPDGYAPRMTVLVAGGTGHLGTAVVRELLAGGYAITATWVVEREAERLAAEP